MKQKDMDILEGFALLGWNLGGVAVRDIITELKAGKCSQLALENLMEASGHCEDCAWYCQSHTWDGKPLNSGECRKAFSFGDSDEEGFYTTDFFDVGRHFGCKHWERNLE